MQLGRPGFRLPTDSEWEVAARSGARTAYGFGGDVVLLDRFAWFMDNSGKHVHPPRELRPNVRGVFDLHGNLWEWTHDWYAEYDSDTATDPLGPPKGSVRVDRGGGWDAADCRSALRSNDDPTFRSFSLGFRPALSPSGASSAAEQREEEAEPAGGGTEGASAEQRPEMP
jgi:formylglycine-generating enzyme required for sulfatase activity